jgi:hypothetical protein
MGFNMKTHDPYGPILAELRLLCDSGDEAVFRKGLRELQPKVTWLRQQYKKCPSRVDFSDETTRLAYLLVYYPHYIEQVCHVLSNVLGIESKLNRQHLVVSFFGPGPAPEALGLALFLSEHCPKTTRLTGYLFDKYVDD